MCCFVVVVDVVVVYQGDFFFPFVKLKTKNSSEMFFFFPRFHFFLSHKHFFFQDFLCNSFLKKIVLILGFLILCEI